MGKPARQGLLLDWHQLSLAQCCLLSFLFPTTLLRQPHQTVQIAPTQELITRLVLTRRHTLVFITQTPIVCCRRGRFRRATSLSGGERQVERSMRKQDIISHLISHLSRLSNPLISRYVSVTIAPRLQACDAV